MMDWTDRHERYFLRLFSRHILLYTEMITTGAILHGDRERLLGYDAREHPLALQVGGSDPEALAECARIGQDYGYDEVNLNLGCPSDRVQTGRFGACLMAEPDLVARCVDAMRRAVEVPVTVKTRIGIDDRDSYGELTHFVQTVASAGCEVFVVHARKAWLKGLSPKENREVPPLRYDMVYRLKQDFPDLEIVVNGGIQTQDQIREHLDVAPGDGACSRAERFHHRFLRREACCQLRHAAPAERDFLGRVDALQEATGVALQHARDAGDLDHVDANGVRTHGARF